MADVTLTWSGGTSAVACGELWLQRAGNWSAPLRELDAETLPSGPVTLSWQGLDHVGYVLRAGQAESVVSAMILGGRGGLTKKLEAKGYDNQFPVSLVLGDILREAGEQLSPKSDAAVLSQPLSSWLRLAGTAEEQLSLLTDSVGAVWRVLEDGSVWVGIDSYPRVPEFEHTVPDGGWHPTHGLLEIVPSAVGALPGQRYEREVGGAVIAGRIAAAVYCTSGDGPSARLYLADERAPQTDNAMEPLRAFVLETMRGVDLLGTITGKVVMQRPNGTLDVTPDDKRYPPMTGVRIRVPVPGARLSVPANSRCDVVFENGDVRGRVAVAYEPVAPGQSTKAVARVGDKTVKHKHVVTFNLTAPPMGGLVEGTITLSEEEPAIAQGSPHFELPS